MKPSRSYSFRSIYPRVRTKITPNNVRFIILNPTQRTSKSAPRFLPEKQRRERASTPMHRLPQCHLGNPRVECQNTYQVNLYNTPLSPRVFICKTRHISCVLRSEHSVWQEKLQRVRTQFITTSVERGETSHDPSMLTKPMIHQDRDISRSHAREIKHIATGTNP